MGSTGTKTVTLAFVDDHPVVLAGMSNLFSSEPGYQVVATGVNAADALAIAQTHAPDVVFVDLSMPGDVWRTISDITSQQVCTKVIVLTAFSSVNSAVRALDAGAAGFVLKSSSFDDLIDAIGAVLRGELYVTKQYLGQVVSGLRHRDKREEMVAAAVKLSVREKQIVKHLLEARTNREIANSLSISEQTVKNYMSSLMSKLHARNRVEVIIAAQKTAALD